MATPVLDVAILWKIQYLIDECSYLGGELAQVGQQPDTAWKIPTIAEKLGKFSQELKDVTGGDKGKAWDVVKANLEGSIEKQERLLASGGIRDGDARLATEREVAQLKKALDGLNAEGRP